MIGARLLTHRADTLRGVESVSDSGLVTETLEPNLEGLHLAVQPMSEKRRRDTFGDIPDAHDVGYANGSPDVVAGDVLLVTHRDTPDAEPRRFKVLEARDMAGHRRATAYALRLCDPNTAAAEGGS